MRTIHDLLALLSYDDYVNLIKKRIPVVDSEIKIVEVGVKVHKSNAFIDVPFYFELGLKFPEVLYTHFYHSEINNYLDNKLN